MLESQVAIRENETVKKRRTRCKYYSIQCTAHTLHNLFTLHENRCGILYGRRARDKRYKINTWTLLVDISKWLPVRRARGLPEILLRKFYLLSAWHTLQLFCALRRCSCTVRRSEGWWTAGLFSRCHWIRTICFWRSACRSQYKTMLRYKATTDTFHSFLWSLKRVLCYWTGGYIKTFYFAYAKPQVYVYLILSTTNVDSNLANKE